jgi:hypothetical protein
MNVQDIYKKKANAVVLSTCFRFFMLIYAKIK